MKSKYWLICQNCEYITESYEIWLENGQKCKKCHSVFSLVKYSKFDKKAFDSKNVNNLWVYKNLLPIKNDKYITSLNEGALNIEQWKSLEQVASKYFSTDCKVFVLRNDSNPGTGTFKDLAGTVISSVFNEIGIKNYVVASTGNIGAALSRYLAINNISFYAFIPKDSSTLQESEIKSNGGNVFRVDGDYSKAKDFAKEFAYENNFLLGGSGVDPLRIEAKKTMIFEFYRQKKFIPDVFIQAVSGGTGPIGVYKGSKELIENNLTNKIPKIFLYQSEFCSPMADAYTRAMKMGFEDKWFNEYEVIENPKTKITTLATGNPSLYPYLSKMVFESSGLIKSVSEKYILDIFKFIALNETVKIGPAACISILGFLKSLSENDFNNGSNILINIGEGAKRTPAFFDGFSTQESISNLEETINFSSLDEIREERILTNL